jgi:hypothetical protein
MDLLRGHDSSQIDINTLARAFPQLEQGRRLTGQVVTNNESEDGSSFLELPPIGSHTLG